MAKQRAFYDPSRNDAIRQAGPDFSLGDLDQVNHTELVQLCNLIVPEAGAHLGMDRSVLEEVIVGVIPDGQANPVDQYRAKLYRFIRKNWEKIRDQLEVNCGGNCYECHDFLVLGCYATNSHHLKEPEEG